MRIGYACLAVGVPERRSKPVAGKIHQRDALAFEQYLAHYQDGKITLEALKRLLYRIAGKQEQPYLKQSLYLMRQCDMM